MRFGWLRNNSFCYGELFSDTLPTQRAYRERNTDREWQRQSCINTWWVSQSVSQLVSVWVSQLVISPSGLAITPRGAWQESKSKVFFPERKILHFRVRACLLNCWFQISKGSAIIPCNFQFISNSCSSRQVWDLLLSVLMFWAASQLVSFQLFFLRACGTGCCCLQRKRSSVFFFGLKCQASSTMLREAGPYRCVCVSLGTLPEAKNRLNQHKVRKRESVVHWWGQTRKHVRVRVVFVRQGTVGDKVLEVTSVRKTQMIHIWCFTAHWQSLSSIESNSQWHHWSCLTTAHTDMWIRQFITTMQKEIHPVKLQKNLKGPSSLFVSVVRTRIRFLTGRVRCSCRSLDQDVVRGFSAMACGKSTGPN